jgi:predicted nucleic acid-binding protein
MDFLLDTNILIRIADEQAKEHLLIVKAVTRQIDSGHRACVVPQNLIEFWNVASRPRNSNGLGWDLFQIEEEVAFFLEEYFLLAENPNIFLAWQELVVQHQVSGKQVHDTKLVAAMLTHKIDQILTLNTADFTRFSQITAIHPATILEEETP